MKNQLLILAASLLLPGCTQKEYTAANVTDDVIVIDGANSEPEWQGADVISDFSNPWNVAVNPATSLSMVHDSASLYFFFDVEDDDLTLAPAYGGEMDVTKEDRVELFFSKDRDMHEYFGFEIDAKGRTLSYSCSYYRKFNYNWESPAGFTTAGHIRPSGYSVEGAIPLSFLNNMLQSGGTIYFGAYRAAFRRSNNILIENWLCWRNPKTPEPDFHVPASLGKLKL